VDHHKILAPKTSTTDKRIKALEITRAYAEYKTRHAGDLDGDLANWANNIMLFIEIEKHEK